MLARRGTEFTTSQALLITVAITTVCWIIAAYVGPQTDRDVLRAFYRKVRPFGPGWARIRAEVGPLPPDEAEENIPRALVGWLAGCTMIWSALFATGNFLYGTDRLRGRARRPCSRSPLRCSSRSCGRLWRAGGCLRRFLTGTHLRSLTG